MTNASCNTSSRYSGPSHLASVATHFTDCMVCPAIQVFERNTHISLSHDNRALQRLRRACEGVKRTLSAQTSASIELEVSIASKSNRALGWHERGSDARTGIRMPRHKVPCSRAEINGRMLSCTHALASTPPSLPHAGHACQSPIPCTHCVWCFMSHVPCPLALVDLIVTGIRQDIEAGTLTTP